MFLTLWILCGIAVAIEVQFFTDDNITVATGDDGSCVAAYLHAPPSSPDINIDNFDYVFTNNITWLPFGQTRAIGERGELIHLDEVEFTLPTDASDPNHKGVPIQELLMRKTSFVSLLFPPVEGLSATGQPTNWPREWLQIYAQASEHTETADHIYFDGDPRSSPSERFEVYKKAFERYRFTIILDDLHKRDFLSEAMINALAYHTVPAYNGYYRVSTMFANAVAAFNETYFEIGSFLGLLHDLERQMKFLWSYQDMLLDVLYYRYHEPFSTRLWSTIETLCGSRRQAMSDIFLGIYSSNGNFEKRDAIRRTWLRVFAEDGRVKYKFFLGRVGAMEGDMSRRVREEIAVYNDIVLLDVPEGYRYNSQKGLLFLEWVARNVEARMLIKADDDIYLRPEPLIHMIRRRPSVGYLWGFIDYISPVPRDEGHNFHNTWGIYPYETFPTYPRGVVRVMSIDVVRKISRLKDLGKLRMVFGDDPCLGVHLRQAVYTSIDGDRLLPSLIVDDFGSYSVFAMEPVCEKTWSSVKAGSWVVHHVGAEEIRCMWRRDVEGGYYTEDDTSQRLQVNSSLWGFDPFVSAGHEEEGIITEDDGREHERGFPELCECLVGNSPSGVT
ncbi:hypothetical protein FOL47_005921 [Perkinsus chesapeaki]|uniref:UDP-Gal betaGal beta 1,3-galactosyltransferase, polypeptide 6 n=1 Tax=Perkinsus chesapeaki TaxID=330153 RepID=A0A7J6LUY0_PERCH|nr:hypothetical protein FOL47_005921 [Perkinsus chesapeaki]